MRREPDREDEYYMMDRSRLLKFLLPYLWPKDNPRLRGYLEVAFVFMVAAKVTPRWCRWPTKRWSMR